MTSNDCGKRIKDRNGNYDRKRKRQTMARKRKWMLEKKNKK